MVASADMEVGRKDDQMLIRASRANLRGVKRVFPVGQDVRHTWPSGAPESLGPTYRPRLPTPVFRGLAVLSAPRHMYVAFALPCPPLSAERAITRMCFTPENMRLE